MGKMTGMNEIEAKNLCFILDPLDKCLFLGRKRTIDCQRRIDLDIV
jgi:hypothetical protein